MEHYSLFPTMVLRYEKFLNNEQCEEIVKSLNVDNFQPYTALTGESCTSFFMETLEEMCSADKDLLNNLCDKLQTVIDEYCLIAGIQPCYLSNIWFSVQGKDSKLQEHTHPGSVISGAFYLNVDDKSSGIEFRNPNPFTHFTNFFNSRPTEYNQTFYKFQPNNGDLIVFPSWLSHGSGEVLNESDNRVIMSFNSKYEC